MITPSLRPDSIISWATQYRDSAPLAEPGVGLQVGTRWLLWRARTGRVVGCLTLDAVRGFTVMVDPRHRRRGIASRLLVAALERWPLDIDHERYTPAGAAFINAWRR